jgi:hypothetical protein
MMLYRLNLYCDGKLSGTELVDAPLEEAKEAAISALESGGAQRAELVNKAKAIVFQQWAAL